MSSSDREGREGNDTRRINGSNTEMLGFYLMTILPFPPFGNKKKTTVTIFFLIFRLISMYCEKVLIYLASDHQN